MRVNLKLVARQQFLPYLTREQRWACVVAHRRAGKTVACVMDLIRRAVEHKGREPRFAYVAPTYTQAKDVAWSYVKEYTQAIPGVEKSESELSITLPHNGARVRLYGAENYDRIRGLYLDGVVIDEAGDIDPRAWPEVIRPALSDRQGWATFIGTPKGRNAFYDVWRQSEGDDTWFSQKLRASETQLIADGELADARKVMTAEQYAQEYECSFDAAIVGAYYGREMELAEKEGRIRSVPLERGSDIYAAWDLGHADATAIWIFQIVGREWHWLKYYENRSVGLDHYVDWVKGLPFKITNHLLPHDAQAHELQTDKTRKEFLEGRGLSVTVVPMHKPGERIEAARVRFNRFWFDKEGCDHGLDVLRMYRASYDDKNEVLRTVPLHNWASHGADAFGYGVMGADESGGKFEMPQIDWEFA